MDKMCMPTFRLSNQGQHLIVTGGEMTGEQLDIPAIQEYERKTYPVKEIGDSAFSHYDNLKSVIMNKVTIIGHDAFAYCENLVKIHFSNPITQIGSNTFCNCRKLKDINVPIDAQQIGSWAFAYCEDITKIQLTNNVLEIGECAFYGCNKLEEINIPESLHSIGPEAFGRCSSLCSIIIPDSVTYIGKYVFMGCDHLQKVYINKPEMLHNTAIPENVEILPIDAEYFDGGEQGNLQDFSNAMTDDKMEVEEIFELASNYYDKGYRKRGFALYKKAADLGYAKAQDIVGFCYQYGLGTGKDKCAALEWYQKAAEQHFPHAICNLANCYEYGSCGLKRNPDKALLLWNEAAELGDKEAQFILGNLYLYGIYVEQNREEAIKWYHKAAQQNYFDAIKKLLDLGCDCKVNV